MIRNFYIRIFIFLGCVIFLGITCCTNKSSNKENNIIERSPFAPVLEKEIENFIDFNSKSKSSKAYITNKKLYHIFFYNEKDDCYISISTDYFFNKNDIKGYTFIKGDLIVYYVYYPSCCDSILINKDNFIQYKDSIPGYKDYSQLNIETIFNYEPMKRVFKIINRDSLKLTWEGLY